MGNRMGESVRKSAMALLVAAGLASSAANAALIDQGDGTVLDTTTNLEWVKDGSLGGFRTWQGAVDWASGLGLDGGGWEMPDTGELAHIYNEIKNLGGCTGNNCTGDQDPFDNIQGAYWSATRFDSRSAELFAFAIGIQTFDFNDDATQQPAWAVRPGDVAAAPEPASLLLLGVGALGLGWSRRRGRRR